MGRMYRTAADKNVINAFTKARFDEFYALEPNSLDMIFVGSSHSYCTFDPDNFDPYLGISSYQMGTPLQHPDTTYYELKKIFETQSPKVVVMEVYWDVLDDDFEMKQANSFFEVLQDDVMEKEYIRHVFPLGEKVKYRLWPIRYQQDYFAYRSKDLAQWLEDGLGVWRKKEEVANGEEYYRSKGYTYCDIVLSEKEYYETNQFRGLDGKDWNFSPKQEDWMEKIVDLCQEKGSRLIFVTAPIANVSMEYINNYEIIHENVSDFAQRNQVPYIDYNLINQEENLLENKNFRDDAHLNDSGVKIVDQHFLQYLIENNIFSQ